MSATHMGSTSPYPKTSFVLSHLTDEEPLRSMTFSNELK